MVGDWVGFWWWERKLCEREKWKRNGERERERVFVERERENCGYRIGFRCTDQNSLLTR